MFFCAKNARPSFDVTDDEVTCLKPKKTDPKRPVGRLRRYHKSENCELGINELHDFNHQWYSEHYIRFYQEIVALTNTRKRFSTFK